MPLTFRQMIELAAARGNPDASVAVETSGPPCAHASPGKKLKQGCGKCRQFWLCSHAEASKAMPPGGWPEKHCSAEYCAAFSRPAMAGEGVPTTVETTNEPPWLQPGIIAPGPEDIPIPGETLPTTVDMTVVDDPDAPDTAPPLDLPPIIQEPYDSNKFLVSLVIASRQEGANILKTVQSAIAAATGPLEVIITDDASTDGSCDNLEALRMPDVDVRILRMHRPVGAGMARNLGFAAALGRVVVGSDAHMEYPRGIFHSMGQHCIDHQCIMCARISGMGGGSDRAGAQMHLHRDIKLGMEWRRLNPKAQEPERRNAVLGAFYMFPREIYDAMARYPSTLGIWGVEEPAISTWAYFHDVPIYVSDKYIVKHLYRRPGVGGGVPWGDPSRSDLQLNMLSFMHALFDKETYETIWREPNLYGMSAEGQAKLEALENGKLYEAGRWRGGKQHTDYEFFRDCLKVPAVKGEDGKSVVGVRPISIIVTTRNDGKKIADTIVSIVNSCQLPHEIVLVDDASDNGSMGAGWFEGVQRRVYAHWRDGLAGRLKIIRHETPIGCTRSRAEAIRAASGEIYCIFDGHQAVITPFTIEALAATASDRGGIVIPSVCNLGEARKSDRRTYGARFALKDKWGILNAHVTTRPAVDITLCRAVIGCGYTFTRETLARLGGFPELPGWWSYCEQWLGLRSWFLCSPRWIDRTLTIEHFYKKDFGYQLAHLDVLMNAHLTFYVHFGDELYEHIKPRLLMHGWDDRVGELLRSETVQTMRAEFAAQKKRTDREFAELELGVTLP